VQLNISTYQLSCKNFKILFDTRDHRRDSLGLKYVYVVNSRRSGGLSIGINLNTNNACNWQCVYCQVDGLRRGSAPSINQDLLETELRSVIDDILHGDFYLRHNIPAEFRVIRDIAISGNGEPTTCREFDVVVEVLDSVVGNFTLAEITKVVLITNGSQVHHPVVKRGIRQMAEMNGEIWFKLDSATETGIRSINHTQISMKKIKRNLETAAALCPVWLQTCVFVHDSNPPSPEEQDAYLQFIANILSEGVLINGVHLYGIARSSRQKDASRLGRLPPQWLEQYADRIEKTGIKVKVSA